MSAITHAQRHTQSKPAPAKAAPELSNYAMALIRRKAKQLARKRGFTINDAEDIEQWLAVKLLKHLAAFDPEQGHPNVFVKTVVERYAANLLRNSRAEKRDRHRVCSLSMIVDYDDNGPIELEETIGQRELDSRLGRESRDPHEASDLAMDVADVLAGLPPELRDLCERLKHASVSDVARDLGVPRTTLYESIRKLRKHFAEIGLKSYL